MSLPLCRSSNQLKDSVRFKNKVVMYHTGAHFVPEYVQITTCVVICTHTLRFITLFAPVWYITTSRNLECKFCITPLQGALNVCLSYRKLLVVFLNFALDMCCFISYVTWSFGLCLFC